MKIVLSDKIYIHSPSPNIISWAMEECTFKNPAYVTAARFSYWGPPKKIPEFIELAVLSDDNSLLSIPRGVALARMPSELRAALKKGFSKDTRISAPVSFPAPTLPPNADQKALLAALEKAQEAPAHTGVALLVAPTATGKTIAQALAARSLGQRTLVLCKTNFIRDAWRKDLQKLFNVKLSDIGILQQAKVKIGGQFTLASVSTLGRRKKSWPYLYSMFGCIVCDETQIIGSPTLAAFLRDCPAKHIIGMTATPQRNDGKTFLVTALVGKPLFTIQEKDSTVSNALTVRKVFVRPTKFQFASSDEIDVHALTDALTFDMERNELICRNAYKDWENGHSVLITTSRTLHVEFLRDLLTTFGIRRVALLTGETNAKTGFREEHERKAIADGTLRMVVATQQAVKLGANFPALDRLHLAVPVLNPSDLKQLIGRIRRKAKNKQDCCVHYYLDERCSYLVRKYYRVAVPTFRQLQIDEFKNVF